LIWLQLGADALSAVGTDGATVSRGVVVVVGGRVVTVVDVVLAVTARNVVVVAEAPGGVTVRLNVPCDPPYPSTTMKYVCPAVTVGVMREARLRPLEFAHASSLHPDTTSAPPEHTPLRMYRIVSKFVAAPHVWIVAVPETVGVHRKTRSGELPELPQLPACELVPLVVPLNVPPAAEMTVGLLQAPGSVVVVVDVAALNVVVVEAPGAVTVRLKVPCAPPYPSTTMKYVCPAVTVGMIREARNRPLELGHVSSLHPDTTSGPLAHTPLRM